VKLVEVGVMFGHALTALQWPAFDFSYIVFLLSRFGLINVYHLI